jgi:hypothetical protein
MQENTEQLAKALNVQTQFQVRKKSGLAAAIMNFLILGVGYMYCGSWVLGILAFLVTLVVVVATLGYGLFIMVPILIIDGFLAAGRANQRLLQELSA